MLEKKLLRQIDYLLIFVVMAIIVYGMVIIGSAKHVTGAQSGAFGFVEKQFIAAVLGFSVAALLLTFDYEDYKRFTKPLYIFNLLILGVVLVAGKAAGGAQSWLTLGGFGQVQPSEFSKIIMIICFAHYLSNRQGKMHKLKELVLAFVFIGIPLLLILAQPDLGTALVFIAMMFGMLYVAGARSLHLIAVILVGALVAGGALWAHFELGMKIPLEDYQIKRLTIFIDPYQDSRGAGYHVIQSQIAIGSGGVLGKGLFKGTQNQLNFLPEQHTDFIFSVVGEELGFVGAAVLLTLFLILLFRGLRIAMQAKDMFGTLMATGFVSVLAFHILENVGMTVSIMPITGIPLPFFSYGGSALLANLIGIGILSNIHMRRQKLMF